MKQRLLWLAALAFAVFGGSELRAQSEIATEGPNWCAHARQYLKRRNGAPFDCTNASRCIKLNNYGCSQNHSGRAFPGQLTLPDGTPVHDPQKHVVYEHPKWSLAKSIGTLLRYQGLGRTSALTIAETYAPWVRHTGKQADKRRLGTYLPGQPAFGAGILRAALRETRICTACQTTMRSLQLPKRDGCVLYQRGLRQCHRSAWPVRQRAQTDTFNGKVSASGIDA